jgi:surfactin synthase thioesterase subunit
MRNRIRPAILAAPALAFALCAGAVSAAEPAAGTDRAATPATPAAAAAAAAPHDHAHDHPIALRDEAALPIIEHADGTRSAVLDASFLSTSVAKIGPDGEVIIGCVQSRAEYDAFFAAEALPDGAEVR